MLTSTYLHAKWLLYMSVHACTCWTALDQSLKDAVDIGVDSSTDDDPSLVRNEQPNESCHLSN